MSIHDAYSSTRRSFLHGTGIAGDEYVHLLSRVHYVLGVQYPLSAVANGGIYKWKGDRDVPDIHNTLHAGVEFLASISAQLDAA